MVEEYDHVSGQKIYQASKELSLTVRRGQDLAHIQALSGTDEMADGRVVGVFMRQLLGKQSEQVLRGVVENNGKQLHVTAQGPQANFDKRIPWDPKIVGTLGELNLFKTRKPKPNDRFDYLIYDPIVNAIVTVRVAVDKPEEVPIAGQRQKLLHATSVPDPIGDVQLPSLDLWLDDRGEIRRSLTAMPGFGYLVFERSTAAEARKPLDPSQLPNPMERQSIKLKQRLNRPHDLNRLVYQITLADDRAPAKAFAQDNRQTVRPAKGQTVEVQVQAVRQPPEKAPPGAAADPGPEFLASNFFITGDDKLVQQHARAAVGDEADPWRKAQRIEAWVHNNMKVQNFSEAMAPAFRVAETLTGDCSEYAMLAAAMCRAAGVPSRTAIGLIYVDVTPPRPAFLGFHMWTEVYVRGAWVALDATLGQGSVGPGHLKISDHSWHEMRAMTPLLPLMRVLLGRPKIEIGEEK
jgi:hypothetical protein